MNSVITLVADPATAKLAPEIAEAVMAALRRAGAEAGAVDWLAPRIACDIPLAASPERRWLEAAQQALAGRAVDAVLQPAAGRRKRLLVADMESTVIVNEMVDDLAELLGIGAAVAAITRRAMNGEIRFRDALRERVALLGGLEEQALRDGCERIVYMPGAVKLVRAMRAHGAVTALVSGGFRIYTGHVAPLVGFDRHYANDLVIRDGVLTGELVEPILGRDGKRATLEALAAELGIPLAEALAVGDGANDIAMVAAATEAGGLGVAFRAKAILRAATPHRIDHGDLTALLYLQGFRQEELERRSSPAAST
jgi:phosphoserine phosphatase